MKAEKRYIYFDEIILGSVQMNGSIQAETEE